MTDNIINIAGMLPLGAEYVVCMSCAKDWVAVVPKNASWPLECPSCGEMHGEPVAYDDLDWFTRFMDGTGTKKRMYVLLNAKRIHDAEDKP